MHCLLRGIITAPGRAHVLYQVSVCSLHFNSYSYIVIVIVPGNKCVSFLALLRSFWIFVAFCWHFENICTCSINGIEILRCALSFYSLNEKNEIVSYFVGQKQETDFRMIKQMNKFSDSKVICYWLSACVPGW